MSQGEFDFNGFLEEDAKIQETRIAKLRSGLEFYDSELENLETQRCEIEERIGEVTTKRDRLRGMLNKGEEQHKEAAPQRDRGVLIVLRKIVGPDWEEIDFEKPQDFDTIVAHVRRIKPAAKEATIRSGLLRLVKTEVLLVEGKRNSRVWKLNPVTAETAPEPDQEADEEPPCEESTEEAPAPKTAPTRTHDEIVADVTERVLKAVEKKADGIDAKTMAWIMTETRADEVHFEAAVKALEEEGRVEVGKSLADDGQVIRLPADPDSKEALKRTRVEGKPLFPGMETPKHA